MEDLEKPSSSNRLTGSPPGNHKLFSKASWVYPPNLLVIVSLYNSASQRNPYLNLPLLPPKIEGGSTM